MFPITSMRRIALAAAVALTASCGGGGDEAAPATPSSPDAKAYLQALPSWETFSPPQEDQAPTVISEEPARTTERIDRLLPGSVIESQQYACLTTRFSMRTTPEKIVMFSPDRELLWPGALIQGRSHRDGVGSLVGLSIRERAPIKVSIPSLASADNLMVVDVPDQAEVSRAIGTLVGNATTSQLTTPSSIQFTMRDYTSDQTFALNVGLSGKYMGFSASASASVDTAANERTVMVYFVEKMFEVVVEPPSTPGDFFNADFTQAKLDEQIAMGRIGPNNLPVYVSNVVYGRMMAFTFTSTASSSEIKAALNAAYKGIGTFSQEAQAAYKKTLSEARISITSLGGPSAATVDMIASGDWHDYFRPNQPAPLTSAYPISYTFRNLGDGSIAKVAEATEYNVKECTPAGGGGFVLDSFESADTLWQPVAASPGSPVPLTTEWRDAATAQSLFYGYEAARHQNQALTDPDWNFDVGYIAAPARFLGDMRPYYRGELSFWYKPDEALHGQAMATSRYCWTHWILYFPPIWETRCATLQTPIAADQPLEPTDQVYVYDDQTTADQIVLRGGGTDAAGTMLTLTYNPKETDRRMSHGWQKLVLSMSNDDSAGTRLCLPEDPRGCWMVEDRIATEDEIQYVLGDLKEFRIRASYPVYRTLRVCELDPLPEGTECPGYVESTSPIPLGFVGGYFDEIKMTRSVR